MYVAIISYIETKFDSLPGCLLYEELVGLVLVRGLRVQDKVGHLGRGRPRLLLNRNLSLLPLN